MLSKHYILRNKLLQLKGLALLFTGVEVTFILRKRNIYLVSTLPVPVLEVKVAKPL